MKVLNERPPNFDDILKVFPTAKKPGVIFTYGDAIYNPSKIIISSSLMKHEEVHSYRQVGNPALWWHEYLASAKFRYLEELLAHKAEYETILKEGVNRAQRRSAVTKIAKRLSSPLYGNMVTLKQAKRSIQA